MRGLQCLAHGNYSRKLCQSNLSALTMYKSPAVSVECVAPPRKDLLLLIKI